MNENSNACAGGAEVGLTTAAKPVGTTVSSKAAPVASTAASAAGVASQQGQAAATGEARSVVTEEDISKWIQLPRQGSKGRATRGAPSAEEPWQV